MSETVRRARARTREWLRTNPLGGGLGRRLMVLFLAFSLVCMLWHAAVDLQQSWIWYASGIVLGMAILLLFALFGWWQPVPAVLWHVGPPWSAAIAARASVWPRS